MGYTAVYPEDVIKEACFDRLDDVIAKSGQVTRDDLNAGAGQRRMPRCGAS